jgi:hypothetical protein
LFLRHGSSGSQDAENGFQTRRSFFPPSARARAGSRPQNAASRLLRSVFGVVDPQQFGDNRVRLNALLAIQP